MKVLFVGTGLIGGSFSLAMRKNGYLNEAGGYSRNPNNLIRSIDLGIIDQKFDTLEEAVQWADWIILSIPVDVINKLLTGILDMLEPHQTVIDFGSTKGNICSQVASHDKRKQFIAAHPIAGTEYSGPDAAFDSLFEEKMMIICEREKTDPKKLQAFVNVCTGMYMRVEHMEADAHDRHLAYISHLSHITSYALSNAVLDKERDGEVILELAGSGFASTVRLAKSSPEMWTPIFMENRKMVLEALNGFLQKANHFKELLEAKDESGINKFLEEGRKISKLIG
ncbi:MAG: prephenate dehydrogenase [Marinoscillum sp.]|jgi:prephenate dehydrogenase